MSERVFRFNVGDPVTPVVEGTAFYGERGVVAEQFASDGKVLVNVEFEGSVLTCFRDYDLRLVEPAPSGNEPKAPQPEFKVGDRVRVVAVESAMHKMTGYVKRYDKNLSLPYHVESECMNWDNRFRADELEPASAVKECLTVDNVNHPPHYNQGGIECIDAIKAATGSGFVKYCTGNVIKYLWRYDNKGGLEDLKKAAWYLDRAIKEMEVTSE
jgi:hypothetical protein